MNVQKIIQNAGFVDEHTDKNPGQFSYFRILARGIIEEQKEQIQKEIVLVLYILPNTRKICFVSASAGQIVLQTDYSL